MQNPNLPPTYKLKHSLLPSAGAVGQPVAPVLSLCDPQVEHGPNRFCAACFPYEKEGPDGFNDAYYGQYQDGYTAPHWNED